MTRKQISEPVQEIVQDLFDRIQAGGVSVTIPSGREAVFSYEDDEVFSKFRAAVVKASEPSSGVSSLDRKRSVEAAVFEATRALSKKLSCYIGIESTENKGSLGLTLTRTFCRKADSSSSALVPRASRPPSGSGAIISRYNDRWEAPPAAPAVQ